MGALRCHYRIRDGNLAGSSEQLRTNALHCRTDVLDLLLARFAVTASKATCYGLLELFTAYVDTLFWV
jgi:hypothetical protein